MVVLFGSMRLVLKLADGKEQLSMMRMVFTTVAVVNSRIIAEGPIGKGLEEECPWLFFRTMAGILASDSPVCLAVNTVKIRVLP